jgi:diphthine-ammonia ligase
MGDNMKLVFASWSGGKDGCLALYRAAVNGLSVRYLANTLNEDGQRSFSHGTLAEVIQSQSQAIGIPVIQRQTTLETYETEFTNMLKAFKQEGIEGGVFGDIDFNEHREWVERVCQKADIVPLLPLWLESQDKLLREFIDAGFEAIVVAAKADLFGEEVLGRKIDTDFIKDLEELSKTKTITPCGEAGEYHTLVIDGPIFQKRLEILKTRKVLRKGTRFLDILSTDIKDKL